MSELLGAQWVVVEYWLRRVLPGRSGDERGEITEKTIIIAFFAILTLAICGIIAVKLTDTATNVVTNPPATGP